MTEVVTTASVAILLGWAVHALSGLLLSLPFSLALGCIIGLASIFLLRDLLFVRGVVAVMGPIGIVLPLLAIRQLLSDLGLPTVPFGTAELLVFLVVYLLFLAASMNVIPIDIYRLGYAPLPVAVLTLTLCAYGAVTGNLFVPLVGVVGQALWVVGWGSSNWFDHVLHAFLVPVIVVVLIGRLVWT